jgi:hypothetical protein
MFPGIPSQILIDRRGELFETQIGDDIDALREKLNRLLEDELNPDIYQPEW